MSETEIVPNMNLSEAISLYEEACLDIVQSFERIAQAEKKLKAFGEYNTVSHSLRFRRCPDFEDSREVLEGLEKSVWESIVNRMGIKGVMSIKARDELDKTLKSGDMPPLNAENVMALMRGMHARLPELAEEAIKEVWEWLRPPEDTGRAREYKSNPRFELKSMIKLSGVVQCLVRTYWARDYADGKGAAQRGHQSDLVLAINKTPYESGATCETEYFSVRLFLKGAIHVTFRRPDLVAEFNCVCGGMNLRGEQATSR